MTDKEFIKKSYTSIMQNIGSQAKLLAVSKYQSIDKIKYLASLGQLDFGENYLQELEQKAKQMPSLRWHFIGKLQSRKIKHIVKYVNSIQSVEKQQQLEKIDKEARQISKNIDIFLQINIDDDINKSGFKSTQLEEVVQSIIVAKNFINLKVVGLMCLPSKSNFPEKSFAKMKLFFESVNSKLSNDIKLTRLSMGMSADYKIALKYGSTDVRIGSNLFGAREN